MLGSTHIVEVNNNNYFHNENMITKLKLGRRACWVNFTVEDKAYMYLAIMDLAHKVETQAAKKIHQER